MTSSEKGRRKESLYVNILIDALALLVFTLL